MRHLPALLLLCLVASLAAPAARAGAWARAPGEVFLSFSSNMQGSTEMLVAGTTALTRHDSVYLEVGLGHRLTFGAEYGRGDYTSEVMAFLRYTLTPPETPWQLALDFGTGQREVDGLGQRDLLRAGLSIGRGYTFNLPGWMPRDALEGWIALDGVGVWDTTRDTTRWKAEATLGLDIGGGHNLLLQLLAEEWPGQEVAYGVNPSVVFGFSDWTSIEVGLRATFATEEEYGLEVGLWHRF